MNPTFREQRARRNSWLCAILLILLLVGACIFLPIISHAATFRIGQEEQPVNWVEVSPGVYRAVGLNFACEAATDATLTVDQNDSLAAWQQTAELYFFRNEAGVYSFLKIADANTVTPIVAGNKITWPSRWTFAGGSADYELVVTDWRILKTVRFSAAASVVLPSPTSAEFFPGAPESELGFALGSDPFVGERAANVTGEMDGVVIDLDDDQVIGASMTLKWNGAFLHRFPPAYCEGMDGQGQQIYLGDLQCHFSAWSWAQAKTAAWFDPDYTFQDSTYLSDTSLYEGDPNVTYDTQNPLYLSNLGAGALRYIYFNIDLPAIAAAYDIDESTAGSLALTAISLAFKADGVGAGTPKDAEFYRATKAGLTSSLTWNTKGPTSELLWQQHIVSWVAGTVFTTTNTALLTAARQCIAGATYLQLVLKPTSDWVGSPVYGQFNPVDDAVEADRPLLSITITPIAPYRDSLSAAWIDSSSVYVAYPYKEIGDTTSAFMFAFVGTDSGMVSAGTTSYTYGYPDNSHYISQIALSGSVSSMDNVGLYWQNMNQSASGVIVMTNAGTGGGGSTDEYTARLLHINEAIEDVTAAIASGTAALTVEIDANQTAITQNNVLLHEIDFRAKEIQKDTAAGGRVIPASGIASLNVNLQMTQENSWDVQLFGESKTSNEPNLGFWITHGKTPTTAKTYKLATLGDSITYIGAWDSKVDAAAIGGASVYVHAYTAHFTPADATGVYHIAGVCSDGTSAWPIGGDFVFGATPTLQIVDQLTATAFDARADQWDTMLDNAAAGEIVAATVWRANALITRTTASINIDDATDSVYVPPDGDYGQERDYRKADGTIHTIRMLADHDEATTDKKTSKYRVLGPGYTIQTWAAAQGHSISASGRTTP